MTKSQTSKNTQSAKQIVRQISGITSKRSVSSISGTRLAREEFDPTKEHDEMLTRLSEIKSLREELDHERESNQILELEKIYFLIKKMEMFLRSIIHKMTSFMQGLELLLLTSIVRFFSNTHFRPFTITIGKD